MKKVIFAVIVAHLLAGMVCAQTTHPYEKVDGLKSLGSSPGTVIWDNFAASGWFSAMSAGYTWLDWGLLVDQGNNMPDEVVDGFGFSYATDADIGGISWSLFFYDHTTGWGDLSVIQEAGFSFTGLPDARNLPAGTWGWMLWADLSETGYEFLMGYEIGIGHSLTSTGIRCGPCMTYPPLIAGNGRTVTQDAFDIIDDEGNDHGTYWFGGYPEHPYASFCAQLIGGSDPSIGCTYDDIPLQGNNTGLYCVGDWDLGGYNNFLLRLNGMTPAAGVVFNTVRFPLWWPGLVKYTIPELFNPPCIRMIFNQSYTGDYVIFPFHCGQGAVSSTWYIQGVISDWLINGPIIPIDLSMNSVTS